MITKIPERAWKLQNRAHSPCAAKVVAKSRLLTPVTCARVSEIDILQCPGMASLQVSNRETSN